MLPPSAHLPHAVTDLAAQRQGPNVRLQWTPPSLSSDGLRWRGPLQYNLCAWPGLQSGLAPAAPPHASGSSARVSLAAPPQVPSPQPRNFGGDLTPTGAVMPPCPRLLPLTGSEVSLAALGPGSVATLALYAMNASGQGAGWSNLVPVALTTVAPPPQLLTATPTPDGVQLRWQPPADLHNLDTYQVFRQLDAQTPVRLADLPPSATTYLDATTAWNQPYRYWLRSAAGSGPASAQSQDSNHLDVTPQDVFPPPVPTGLQVVVGVAGADLSWNPVTASNFAGYNVYRRVAGGSWQKRNSALLATPVFHDSEAPPPAAEFAVTSVSDTGHESSASAPVTVVPPTVGD